MRDCPEASLKFEKKVEEEEVKVKVKDVEEKAEKVEKVDDQFLTKKGTSQLQEGYHSF